MSYNTISVIISTEEEKEKDFIRVELAKEFPNLKTRKLSHPFKGYVAQLDLRASEDEGCQEQLEVYLLAQSNRFPELKLGLIEVDCFGGRCSSNGKLIQNGEIIQDEADHPVGHLNILKNINDKCKGWHFEPFTRDYFEKKGGIWGEISGEKLGIMCIGIYTSYKDKSGYRCDMTLNEMILHKDKKFYIYLMEPMPGCIKVLGSILDDSEEVLTEIKQFIEVEIGYTNSYVFLDLIEKEELVKLNYTGEEGLKETLYRHQAFNERPLIPETPPQQQQRSTPRKSPRQPKKPESTSFLTKLKRLFGGK